MFGIRVVDKEINTNIDSIRNAQIFESNGKEYCFYDCVSFLLTTQWDQFQNEVAAQGGEIALLNITIPSTQTTPTHYKLGERKDFGLEGDFPLILPIQIFECQQYALVYVNPLTRNNLNDRIVITVTKQ